MTSFVALKALYDNFTYNIDPEDLKKIAKSYSFFAAGGSIYEIFKKIEEIEKTIEQSGDKVDKKILFDAVFDALKKEAEYQQDPSRFVTYHSMDKMVYYALKLYSDCYNSLNKKDKNIFYLRPQQSLKEAFKIKSKDAADTGIKTYLNFFANQESPDYGNQIILFSFNVFLFGGHGRNLSQSSVWLALKKNKNIYWDKENWYEEVQLGNHRIVLDIIEKTCALYGMKDNESIIRDIYEKLKKVDADFADSNTNTLLQIVFKSGKNHTRDYIKKIDKNNFLSGNIIKNDEQHVFENLLWSEPGGGLPTKNRTYNERYDGETIFSLLQKGEYDKKIPLLQGRYVFNNSYLKNGPDYETNIVDLDGKIANNEKNFNDFKSDAINLLEKNKKKSIFSFFD